MIVSPFTGTAYSGVVGGVEMKKYLTAVRQAWSRCLRLPNVLGVGLGLKEKDQFRTDQPAIVVFVKEKLPRNQLETKDLIPSQVDGVETDVMEIGDIRLLTPARTTRIRPAPPGVSIGHPKVSAGTFGALVKDISTGEPLILSNNHVLANMSNGEDDRAKIGDPIFQPGVYDGGSSDDTVAHLLRFIPVTTEFMLPVCPISKQVGKISNSILRTIKPSYRLNLIKESPDPNLVDCALARPLSPGLVTGEILELGSIRGLAEVQLGEAVHKSGRTSGLTSGVIIAIAATLRIQTQPGTFAVFDDQIVAKLPSRGGDSGSLVVNDNNEAVGLLFAGSSSATIANRIQNVMERLKVTFD
jgi:hypothetical protein